MAELTVNVVSPRRALLSAFKATHVRVPGTSGYLGILSGHAPLIAELGVGALMVDPVGGGKSQAFFTTGGVVEVLNDQVTVLSEIIERPEDIDAERARRAKQRALDRLKTGDGFIDVGRAQGALMRADARLMFIENLVNFHVVSPAMNPSVPPNP